MGLFHGGQMGILRELEEITQSEFQKSETLVLLALKDRPEAFPNGLPMPVW